MTLSLGTLSYEITGDDDALERKLEAVEQKWNARQLRWELDLGTEAAEGKLAELAARASAMTGGAIGGGGAAGGLDVSSSLPLGAAGAMLPGNFTDADQNIALWNRSAQFPNYEQRPQPAFDYGAAPPPDITMPEYVPSQAGINTPGMRNAAMRYENEQLREAEEAANPGNAMDREMIEQEGLSGSPRVSDLEGVEPSGVAAATSASRKANPMMRGIRLFAAGMLAFKGVENAAGTIDRFNQEQDIESANDDPEEELKKKIALEKQDDAGFTGGARRVLAWGFKQGAKLDPTGFDDFWATNLGAVHSDVKDDESRLAERERLDRATGEQGRFTRHEDSLRSQIGDEEDELSHDNDTGPAKAMARINRAYRRQIEEIEKAAKDAEDQVAKSKDLSDAQKSQDITEIKALASRDVALKTRQESHEKDEATSEYESREEKFRTDARVKSFEEKSRDDDELIRLKYDSPFGSASDIGDRKIREANERAQNDTNSLNPNDPDYANKLKIIEGQRDATVTRAGLDANVANIHREEIGDRTHELSVGTAAMNRGDPRATAFEDVDRISRQALRAEQEDLAHGKPEAAKADRDLAIEQLRRVEADITKATGAEEVDARYTNLKDQGGDLAELLRQIHDAITAAPFVKLLAAS